MTQVPSVPSAHRSVPVPLHPKRDNVLPFRASDHLLHSAGPCEPGRENPAHLFPSQQSVRPLTAHAFNPRSSRRGPSAGTTGFPRKTLKKRVGSVCDSARPIKALAQRHC